MTYSPEMEMATLGSMLLGDSQVNEGIKSILQGSDVFYSPGHQAIYDVCSSLSVNGKSFADLEIVAHELGERGLVEIGGLDYLIQVAEFVPSPSNGEEYARKVLECWTRREFERLGKRAAELSPDELHIEAEAIRSRAIKGGGTYRVSVLGAVGKEPGPGIPTGWDLLDEILSGGGWARKQVWLIRAREGMGKTPFLTQAALNVAKQGKRVFYVTVDDLDDSELNVRAMKHLTGWGYAPTKSQELNEGWHRKKKDLASLGIVCLDCTDEVIPVETIVLWLERNGPWDFGVVDYLQELRMSDRGLDRMERQTEAMAAFKRLASRLNIPIGMGAQLSNNAQEGKMTKGGRDADAKAGLILTLDPDDRQGLSGTLEVGKNRGGMKPDIGYTFDAGPGGTLSFTLTEKDPR
jgi:replicative DNA helicase